MHGKKYFTCDFQSNQIKYAIKTEVKKKKKTERDEISHDYVGLCVYLFPHMHVTH